MYSIIDFLTRTTNCSITATDNIFVDYHRINSFDVIPACNSLSDHDVQCLNLNNFFSAFLMGSKPLIRKRIITNQAMANFIIMLKNESWENIFLQNDINKSFNLFLNTFLNFYESCFPFIHVTCKTKKQKLLDNYRHKNSFIY
jgi:hypothetical protein